MKTPLIKWFIAGIAVGVLITVLSAFLVVDWIANAKVASVATDLGVRDARRDISAEHPRYHIGVYAPKHIVDGMDKGLLKYGLQPIHHGDVLHQGEWEFWQGYNETIQEHLKSLHGRDIIEEVVADARKQSGI